MKHTVFVLAIILAAAGCQTGRVDQAKVQHRFEAELKKTSSSWRDLEWKDFDPSNQPVTFSYRVAVKWVEKHATYDVIFYDADSYQSVWIREMKFAPPAPCSRAKITYRKGTLESFEWAKDDDKLFADTPEERRLFEQMAADLVQAAKAARDAQR